MTRTDPFLGRRASFMAGKLSMDEARVKVAEDWDSDWAPTPNETGAPQGAQTGRNGTRGRAAETSPAENAI